MALRIGELARRGGVTPAALRYYEAAGLLAPAFRTEGGYRAYEAGALGRIEFIQHAKELGLSIGEIRRLLSGSGGDAKEDAATLGRLVASKLAQVRERTAELRRREARLERPCVLDWRAQSLTGGALVTRRNGYGSTRRY